MAVFRAVPTFLLLCVLPYIAPPLARSARDGAHDFDFEFGTWKTHVRRLVHPLQGSNEWAEYDGTSVVSKIWNGAANLVELDVNGPAGHIEGLSLRVYRPDARQWSVSYATIDAGALNSPAIGEFKDGRGEFVDQEEFNGRTILVRGLYSEITAQSMRFEQAFSDDGGKTWETNWIATDARTTDAPLTLSSAPSAASAASPSTDGQHDFDFELGAWHIHLRRLLQPLTGSTTWVDFDGTSVTRKVCGGRANIEEFNTEDPVSHKKIEGLTLRLFNPKSRQWSLYWVNRANGAMGVPTVGAFTNGAGHFFDMEEFNGRWILVRYVWSKTSSDAPHFEQSFSTDGGATWEPNWITDQTRVKN